MQQAPAQFYQGFSVSGRQSGQAQSGQGMVIVGVGRAEDDPARRLLHILLLLLLSGNIRVPCGWTTLDYVTVWDRGHRCSPCHKSLQKFLTQTNIASWLWKMCWELSRTHHPAWPLIWIYFEQPAAGYSVEAGCRLLNTLTDLGSFSITGNIHEHNRFIDDFYNVLRLPHDFNTEQERTVLVVSRSEDVQEKAIQMGATHAAGLEIIKQAQSGDINLRDYDHFIAETDILPDFVAVRGLIRKRFPAVRNECIVQHKDNSNLIVPQPATEPPGRAGIQAS
ncbi:hypothetical protein E2C01_024079 [Portunus trituberculatus]|uniref:Uncharacterized protein n=1 Tax=Portunus trituberculatus TaxID=210409 RepID=A0A5B7EBQ5_PORTR|nr:hypothetical protein [Portunus trituberculatus]